MFLSETRSKLICGSGMSCPGIPRFIGNDLAWFHDVDASGFVLTAGTVERWHDLSPEWPAIGSPVAMANRSGPATLRVAAW